MNTSFAVTWKGGGAVHVGRLVLAPAAARFEGIGSDRERLVAAFPYRELAGIHTAGAADRLEGRPTLVLELADGKTVRVASVAQSWIASELAKKLSSTKLS